MCKVKDNNMDSLIEVDLTRVVKSIMMTHGNVDEDIMDIEDNEERKYLEN